MNRFRIAALGAAMLLSWPLASQAADGSAATGAAATNVLATDAQRWDLRDLYPSPEAWAAAYQQVDAQVAALPGLKVHAGDGAAALRDALVTMSDVLRALARLDVYASLSGDENLRDAQAQARRQQMSGLFGRFQEASAWLKPAVQQWGADKVRGWIAADPVLRQRFDQRLNDILRQGSHVLSPDAEAMLAAAGPALSQANVVFGQLVDSELPFRQLTLADGRSVRLDVSTFELERQSSVRDDRKRVFDGFFGALKDFEGTLGANLSAAAQAAVFEARARRYGNTLEAALFEDNMPPAVYRQLVAQAQAGLPTLHRYLKLRQKMLGITGQLAYYDNYAPLLAPPKGLQFDLARSRELTLAALAPLGDEYLTLLQRGMDAQWFDSHPRPDKASGGYMAGWAYDVHPYLLLNHSNDYNSLSTYAHEWGHAVHTLLANAQPFEKADYATFIAESASIGNEMLLSDYMLGQAKTREEKLYYLTAALEAIRTTFFRQTMFAEFQLAMNEEVEAGRPITGPRLSTLYCGIAKRYYGEAEGVMTLDPAYCVEWAYVSHFYRPYYVWQYATSMVGAAEFTAAIQREGAPARARFIALLKAGGSDYPYALYKRAGIDMARPEPYLALMARMNRLLDEFEALAGQSSR